MSDEAQRAVDANPKDAAAWHGLGLARQNLARHGDAVQAFAKAAALDRGVARYQHDLGNALLEDGKVDRAITAYRRALRIDESLAEVHNDLGTAYFEKLWHAEAEACFRRAIQLKPDHGVAYANLGATLRAQGRLQEGRREFQRALVMKIRGFLPRFLQWRVGGRPELPPQKQETGSGEAERAVAAVAQAMVARDSKTVRMLAARAERRFPQHADVLYVNAQVLAESNKFAEALTRMDAAIALRPERAEYHVLRARALLNCGRPDEAVQSASRALQLEPGSVDAHCVLSGAYRPTRPDLAEQVARRAVELDGQSHAAHGNLSASLWELGCLDEAERHAREALRLSPTDPNYPLNLAIILKDAGRLGEARTIYHDQAQGVPDHAHAMLNLGTLALECDADLGAARAWFAKGLALKADAKIALSDSIVDLLDGKYDVAWEKYEARKKVQNHREGHAPYAGFRPWDGEKPIAGRLLVYGEQGLGDEVMFASMYGELAPIAERLTLVCDRRLEKLFRRSFAGAEIVPVELGTSSTVAISPERVAACGSLGRYLRRSSRDFPDHRGYLVPDPDQTHQWKARLDSLGVGRKIGLSWRGGVVSTGRARRSIELRRLGPLLDMPNTNWVSLQYGDCAAEIADFTAASGIPVQVFPGVTDDMDDLASLVQTLDLVISVCNTTVHIAGAIGKEVLVMAPFLPEWRYGMRGERMLWYPSARIFRQSVSGDWESVIASVAKALTEKTA